MLKLIIQRDNNPPIGNSIKHKKLNISIMKQSLLIVLTTLTFQSFGQLTKGNWLVGGTGNFLTSKNTYTSPTYSSTSERIDINISPNVGYFIIDKLAAGLRSSFSKYKEQVNGAGGGYSNLNRFEFGPFMRYYFLSAEKQYNILSDINYQYGLYWFTPTKGSINTFSASAGPVIYFNSSVGMEFLLGYYSRKEVIQQNGDIINHQKGFQIGIGFQIHLEK
jgi:hypothetical protein